MASTKAVINKLRRQTPPPSTPVGGDFHLPNHSGRHDAGTYSFTDGSVIFAENLKLAQDNSNFFWDNVNKRLGIGTTTPELPLHIISETPAERGFLLQSTGGVQCRIETCADPNFLSAGLALRRCRGTIESPEAVQEGSVIGNINFQGYDGTEIYPSAFISAIVDDAVDTAQVPSRLRFVTANSTGTLIEAMRIDSSQNVGIGNTAPNSKLDVNGDTRLGDSTTNYTEFSATGDQVFVGSAGLAFGEIYVKDNSTVTTITTANTPVQVTIFDTNGYSNNTTPDHTNDHIAITKAGKYMVTVSSSVESVAGGGSTMSMDVYKNNGATIFNNLHSHRDLSGGGGEVGAVALSGIIDLDVNDTVEVWIKNTTGTENYIIEDITLSITQIGG